jgi:hypothetical protein
MEYHKMKDEFFLQLHYIYIKQPELHQNPPKKTQIQLCPLTR